MFEIIQSFVCDDQVAFLSPFLGGGKKKGAGEREKNKERFNHSKFYAHVFVNFNHNVTKFNRFICVVSVRKVAR